MEAVGHPIGVEDVNVQPIAGPRIDHGAGDAVAVERFVYVGQDELVGLRNEVVGIEILAIQQRRQAARIHLRQRDGGVLVAGIAHAIASIRTAVRGGLDRAVGDDLFDPQIHVPDGH
jgi:hypothetical protein